MLKGIAFRCGKVKNTEELIFIPHTNDLRRSMFNKRELLAQVKFLLPYSVRCKISKILSKRREKKGYSIESRLAELRDLIIFNHPIHMVPQATGKLRLLQEGNAALLHHFASKCEECGLQYWMDYGTLLGAVRHKGVIPWDDDLDVGMMVEDYNTLSELLPTLFREEDGFRYSRHAFIQIGVKGTPLNIDIFPYYRYSLSDSEESRAILLSRLSNVRKRVVYYHGKLNMTVEQCEDTICHEVLKGEKALDLGENPLIFLSPVAMMIRDRIFSADDIFPLKKIPFESASYRAPHRSRRYLEILYGDYMSYPPKVGFWHQHLEDVVKNVPFESEVNAFIDKYGL